MLSRPHHPEPHRRRFYNGPYPAVLTALALGTTLSALGAWAAHEWEGDRVELAFGRATATITASIEDCFYHQIDNVRSVAALYEALPDRISRSHFRSIVEPLVSRCEALVGMNWAPSVSKAQRALFETRAARERPGYRIVEYDGAGQLVPAGERDAYFPILYTEPSEIPGYPPGFDLASRPRERATIEHIRRTGRMVFVPHDPTHDARSPTLEVVLKPIYRSHSPSSGPGGRQPMGFILGMSRLSGIVDEALQHAGNPALGLDVLEVLPDGTRQVIYSRPSASAGSTSWTSAILLPPAIAPRETQLAAAEHAIVLRFVPDHGVYGVRPGWLPSAVLVAGLIFTGLLAVYLDRTRRNTERIAQLARRLSEQDARKNEFLAVLGHELRNPIAPISNAVHVLRARRAPAPETVEWAEGVIERQVTQLARLVDDLLDVARITRGDIALREEHLDLTEIVQRAIETQRPLIDAKQHVLRERLPSDPVPVRGDRARLIQVVSNLLENAAKYTPNGGRIDIDVASEGGEAAVSVRDSGIGISSDHLPRIFDFFNQVPNHDRHQTNGGLGLGLGLARRLIEMHGGRIEARSAGEGAGSQFTVRLPVSSHPVDAAPPTRTATNARTSRRVLVVEDNEDVARSFEILLETMGHRVTVAHDGPAALDAARSFCPEIAFVDIGLPGMDGYELARKLRRQSTPTPYLIAVTGYGQARDRELAAIAGFDRHLVKPVDMASLEEVFASAPAPAGRPA
jgi:signal transduction histidine kinase/ActR/RegA family two-component response regulator